MKKIYALIMLLAAVSVSADAASKWKLYVNPGHGGYTSNDRQTAMPAVNGVKFTETQGCFWESEGNTYRAWGVEYFWKKRVNSNVKLSRYTNTQSGDKTLSVIAQESNAYGGYFMSLHTNAGNASANYMIIMCGATSKTNYTAKNPTSLEMAQDAAYWQGGEATAGLSTKGYGARAANHMTQKSYKTDRGTTDRTFYNGSGLGVLNTNNAPGYLAESWFHDYRPEAFRLMSVGYNYFLAWQLMRAYLDTPGLDGVGLYPIIFGDIRDTSKSCGYTSYASRNRDKYLAINGAKVTLTNVATGGQKTYMTDKFNNGFYTFYDCVPGATYRIDVEYGGKHMTKTITVDNSVIGTQHKLDFNWDDAVEGSAQPAVGMSLSSAGVSFDNVYAGEPKTETVKVTGTGLSADISVAVSGTNSSLFTVSAATLAKTGGDLTITYSPTEVGSHSATITLTSGSITKTIKVEGKCINEPIYFGPGWYASEIDQTWENKLVPTEWDYTEIRSICYGGGKLYLSSPDTENKIHIINARTGAYIKSLDMTGVTGGAKAFCDIKYVGGKIVATSIANTNINELKVYVWDNDNAAPKCILNTAMPEGFDRVGDTFYVKGDLVNGGIYYAGHHSAGYNSIICYPIVGGVASTSYTTLSIADNEMDLGTAPRVIAETSGKFWVDGKNINPTLLDASGQAMATVNKEAMIAKAEYNGVDVTNPYGNAFKSFTFKGVTYGMATTFLTKGQTNNGITTTENYQMGRAVLFDATAGWANATYVADYPWRGMGMDNTKIKNTLSTGIEVAVNGDKGVEAWILIHGQGIVYIKYGTVPSSTIEEAKTPVLTVDKTAIEMEAMEGESAAATVSVAGTDLAGNIELGISGEGASAFSLSANTLEASDEVTVTFSPNKEGTYNAVLTVTSDGAVSKTVELTGNATANLNELGDLTEGWNYSTKNSSMPSWLVNDNATANVRSIAYANGKLYILQNKGVGTATVDVVDAFTGATQSELNLTGVGDGIVSLSSLVAVDGVVLGSNVALSADEAASRIAAEPETFAGKELETLKVYRWTSDNAAPEVIISDKTHAAMSMGAKISFSGNMTNGRIWFTNQQENAVLYYEIVNGTVAQTPVVIKLMSGSVAFHNDTETSAWGSGSVYYNEDGTFWADFKDDLPTLFSAPVDVDGTLTSSEVSFVQSGLVGGSRFGSDFKLFNYKDKKYALATTYLGRDDREYAEDGTTVTKGEDNRLRQGAFALIDVTEGVENATSNMGVYPADGLGDFKNDHFITNICVNPRENGVDIWVCVYGQGVAYYYYGEDGATGIESIDAEVGGPAEYYNLQGVRVMNPSKGLFIKKQGNKATKVVL